MLREQVIADLREFVAREILDGQDIGLDETTPLLEWGIINSFEIARVTAFVTQRFGVTIPPEQITVRHFDTLAHLAELVLALAEPTAAAPDADSQAVRAMELES